MSNLTVYRLKMVLGLAFLLIAGALLIFWKFKFSYLFELASALIGTHLVFSKAAKSEDIQKVQNKFSPSTVRMLNIGILAVMAFFVIVGVGFAVTH